ncbi:CAZyme family GH2 [Paecilomyces variotii]|nr:CAZyme family GH2 [Paecilomyces variotii]KAJ9256692.1 CAZyme family GH2 [Paecilomyces variotii]KAJ9348281.1 CAZyme family GH2 [Paecilomyces variotii]KAJ9393122.1 CAZyme family GH2 [Paecilomyces variotii]
MVKIFEQTLSTGWYFKQVDDAEQAWMPVPSIPSVVHQDLLANGEIPDPFIGFNELRTDWVGERAWVYRTSFESPPIHPNAVVDLLFEGLDTFAKVKLDGTIVLESDNMFLSHRLNVTDFLKAQKQHVLEIEFDSALIRARKIKDSHPDHRWVGYNGEMARLGVRKAQYHWGWDWGPLLMTAGIWRPVRLEMYSIRVDDICVETQLSKDHQAATVMASAQMTGDSPAVYKAVFSLSLMGHEIERKIVSIDANGNAKAGIDIVNPQLWWPNGYGPQTLYELSVCITKDGEAFHQVSKKIGIRSAEVVQELDKYGKSFLFRINGVDIFCGGSCWIPADSFLPSITKDRYRQWIELMAAGRQVMIRVWGGGIYEDDSFYDACDEYGIMVWQDFMFGCGNYPTWPAMLDSIRKEATCNVRRLRHHPAIVILAGNNEDYQVQEQEGLTYDFEDKNRDNWLKSDFPARYIYEELLPTVIREECPWVFYHPGSPWGDGKPTSDPTVGDLHQWNVWHGTQEKYQLFGQLGGRFNSEFGMEAFPHLETVNYFVKNEIDKFPQSHIMDFHNKAAGHERRIATYVEENLRTSTDLETYIHLTQVVQAETMLYAYRGWRRQWGDNRRCGGALVWQLNDCWPAISWAIVDYFLRPKPAYYAIARALSPVAVGVQREHHDWSVSHARPPKTIKYNLWVASSLQTEVVATVELRFISISTGSEICQSRTYRDIHVMPNGTIDIILDGIIDCVAYPEAHVLAARLWIGDRIVSRDIDWPQPYKYLDLTHRGLEIKQSVRTDDERIIVISAKKPVKCLVFEERDGVSLSDSALDIVPGDYQTVTITGLNAGDEALKWKFLGQ